MTVYALFSIAFVLPLFLALVLHRTRAFWLGGLLPCVVGFYCLAFGNPLAAVVGIGLIIYGFVLLVLVAYLHGRHMRRVRPPIPPATVVDR